MTKISSFDRGQIGLGCLWDVGTDISQAAMPLFTVGRLANRGYRMEFDVTCGCIHGETYAMVCDSVTGALLQCVIL